LKVVKKTVCLLCMALSVLFTGLSVSADTFDPSQESSSTSISTRAEVKKWYYRDNPTTGKREMRLWSVTRGIWLTEWKPA